MNSFILLAFIATAPFLALTQASVCSDGGNWQCKDGTCITMVMKCDGRPDCPDHSDETHANCFNHYCPVSRFRCAYGACVDGTAPCNDFPDCLDRSDELLPRCTNTTTTGLNFQCRNGDSIPLNEICDGEKNCPDGSDETLEVCSGRRCDRQFQCKYGACVPNRAKCDVDARMDCADGSDEDHVLCNRPLTVIPSIAPTAMHSRIKPASVSNTTSNSKNHSYCELPHHPSITYFCDDQQCSGDVLSGAIARPQCNDGYIYNEELRNMYCIGTKWNYLPICVPEIITKIEGNNITLYIGKEWVVHLEGSNYTASVDYDSKTLWNASVPEQSTTKDTVPDMVQTTLPAVVSDTPAPPTLNPVFDSKYDPIAWNKKHNKNDV